jgi:hypothetical protein
MRWSFGSLVDIGPCGYCKDDLWTTWHFPVIRSHYANKDFRRGIMIEFLHLRYLCKPVACLLFFFADDLEIDFKVHFCPSNFGVF